MMGKASGLGGSRRECFEKIDFSTRAENIKRKA